jgi:hypothetical protein
VTTSPPNATRVRLAGTLTVRGIEAPHAELRAALQGGAPVLIDCSAAAEVDVSLIQVLLAARRDGGERVRLATPLPEVLAGVLRRGGFLAAGSADLAFWQPEGTPA